MRNCQLSLSKRSGLVGADAGHAPNVLDRNGAPYQRLAMSKAVNANAKKECKDDWKFFGERSDGERYRAQKGIDETVSLCETDHCQRDAQS